MIRTKTNRALVTAALVSLPLAGTTTATAAVASQQGTQADHRAAYAAQQESYVGGLQLAAGQGSAVTVTARQAYAAQQQAYIEHLLRAGRAGAAIA